MPLFVIFTHIFLFRLINQKHMYPKVFLKPQKDKSVLRFHPWIFSGAIANTSQPLSEGDIVEVFNAEKKYVGTGYYQANSISVKLFSFKQTLIDKAFWKEKIASNIRLREQLHLFDHENLNVFRLVNAEGDFMPGFIADWYNGVLVFQFHAVGMYLLKECFVEIFTELLFGQLKAIYNKSMHTLPQNKNMQAKDEFLWGESDAKIVVNEYGKRFYIDVVQGQKTGFFVDQRENRKLLESLAKDKKVLNMFGYTGGFSVAAYQAGAQLVHTVDVSQKAVNLTNENIALNFSDTGRHQAFAADAFDFLDKTTEIYDILILDPPALVKHNKDLDNGLKAYRKMNKRAMECVSEGGFMFTFSCSQAVSKGDFRTAVFSAAAIARRNVRVIAELPHAADHPVSIFHPEGDYLKGLLLYIE